MIIYTDLSSFMAASRVEIKYSHIGYVTLFECERVKAVHTGRVLILSLPYIFNSRIMYAQATLNRHLCSLYLIPLSSYNS